jgi:hypothetical protein
MHRHHERPSAIGVGRFERDGAEPAEANLGDTAARFEPADGAHAAIDAAFAERPARYLDPQGIGVIDEGFDERLNFGVDARPLCSTRFDDLFSLVHLLPPCSHSGNQTGL